MKPNQTLYRPIGRTELELIAASGFRHFPPRLAEQPIFYPVLTRDYAIRIARDWNTKDAVSGFAGFVTAFKVDGHYLERFDVQVVGADEHKELWVPAEQLDDFNAHILGRIQVIDSFYGDAFEGEVDTESKLPKDVIALFAD